MRITNQHQLLKQRGVYIVELAFAAPIFLFMVFCALEVARLMYTWSALDAATQRGARVAAVCPQDDLLVKQIAIFGDSVNASAVLPNLTPGDISVAYLDGNGAVSTAYADIRLVQVEVSGYTHQMLIPAINAFVSPNLLSPTFTATKPSESLGWNPDSDSRVCFS